MTAFRQNLKPHTMIPWVLALLAVFGWNLVAQQQVPLRKSAPLNGGSVTQLASEAAPTGAPGDLQLVLGGGSFDGIRLRQPDARRLAIAPSREILGETRRDAAVQGRAPPLPAGC